MMAVAFASVVWSIFAGFRISRFQWLFVMGSVIWFLGMCRLLNQNKRNIVVMVVICIIYCMLAHRQLINGFQIINNKMAEALNQSMDLGFYYYISVTLEHSRRDSVLAVLFFVLVAGIVLGILRCRPLTLFLTTGFMEMAVLMIAPYGISAAFFLFLGSWIVYFSIRKGKKGFAAGLYIVFLAAAVPLFFYDQTNVPTDTMIKRNILIQIREWTQGKGYLAVGGIGNGKLRSVGEVSPKGEKLFLVYAPENADLYLKGFVSGRYKDGEWTKEKKNTLVYGGEMAQELPYLFPDLSMKDFAVYQKGYIQTPKDIAFSEKREIKIHYQKMQESFLLIPYFSDASRINGNAAGDSVIERNTADTEYTTSYYQIKNNKNLLDISQRFDVMSVLKNAGELEKNYVRSMQEYGTYVQQNYLEIPEEIKKTIKQLEELFKYITDETGYIANLKAEETEEAEGRIENINELLNKVVTYEQEAEEASLSELLEEIALVADIDNLEDSDNRVVLMTLHSAKGLEFPYVFICGMEDGIFPSYMTVMSEDDDDMEEERRLCYVGITRAKKKLYLSAAKRRMMQGRTQFNKVSRFIDEIPEQLLQLDTGVNFKEKRPDKALFSSNRSNRFRKPYQAKSFTSTKMDTLPYDVGDMVKHIKFGKGKVLEIVSGGRDYEVTVDFEKAGVKKMFASFAKLKKVE